MDVGDVVVCRDASGYPLIEGKEYAVLAYEPKRFDTSVAGGFTWPAYVIVKDDRNKYSYCHASRFVPKED